MEKRKEMKRGGRQTHAVLFLVCKVITLFLTWMIAMFSCLLTMIYSPHSDLSYHLKACYQIHRKKICNSLFLYLD